MAATADVPVETLRMLIDPTPEQQDALHELAAAFQAIHDAVRRIGPMPEHSKIRRAFENARETLDRAQTIVLTAKPSEEATKRGLRIG